MTEKIIRVKFKNYDKDEFYSVDEDTIINLDEKVVVKLNGTLMLGKVCGHNRKDILKADRIVRKATWEDIEKQKTLDDLATKNIKIAKELIKERNLSMKILGSAYSLDKSKIFFIFSSEGRVDFRDLVKALAKKLGAKIELRQVSTSDEMKMLGGVGPCGQVCCCRRFLNTPEKVGLKTVKQQNIAIAPNKVNGVCGKLMCCFKYENDTYVELSKGLPKINSLVITPDGKGKVVYNNILEQKVTVRLEQDDGMNVKKDFDIKEIKFCEQEV